MFGDYKKVIDGIVVRKFGIYLITDCHLYAGSIPTCEYSEDLYQ